MQVNAVQRTLVEAWGIVRETYVDPTFNNQGIPFPPALAIYSVSWKIVLAEEPTLGSSFLCELLKWLLVKSSCGTNFKSGVFVLYLLLIHLSSPDWDLKLQEVLGETLSVKTSEDAYGKIRSMLATLGDPFTRIVSPQVRILFGNLIHVSLCLQESEIILADVWESRSNLVCVSL